MQRRPTLDLIFEGNRVRMRLVSLKCPDTRVSDLSPLKGMPLESVWVPDVSAESREILRGMKSLRTINAMPATEFWKEIDAHQ